jgi:hypothetical protein
MFKNVISPIQAWLMSQGRCVGCGMPLSQGKASKYKNGSEKVVCKCKRIYIHETGSNRYRRALIEEV